MLAVFAEFERDILRDRVKAGIAQARKEGRPHDRPPSARLKISRSSVRRLLDSKPETRLIPRSRKRA
jgi:DNA invertase Pin-like site-specific DNA recombinase